MHLLTLLKRKEELLVLKQAEISHEEYKFHLFVHELVECVNPVVTESWEMARLTGPGKWLVWTGSATWSHWSNLVSRHEIFKVSWPEAALSPNWGSCSLTLSRILGDWLNTWPLSLPHCRWPYRKHDIITMKNPKERTPNSDIRAPVVLKCETRPEADRMVSFDKKKKF